MLRARWLGLDMRRPARTTSRLGRIGSSRPRPRRLRRRARRHAELSALADWSQVTPRHECASFSGVILPGFQHARHLAAARKNSISGAQPRRGSTPCRSMSAIAATSPACTATSTPARTAPRRWTARPSTSCSRCWQRRRIATLDITGGAPELNPHFRRLVRRRARHRRAGDGPLQSHHPGTARPGGSGGVPRRPAGRDRRVDALLPRRQRRSPARQGRLRRLDPRPEAAQCAGLRPRGRPASSSISSTIRKGRRCRRRRRRSRPTTGACSATNSESSSTALFTLANMPIQRFGSILISKGEFDDYMELLRTPIVDDNLDGVMCRSLISVDWRGYRLRLRLQPDARSAADARPGARDCTSTTC